jgi:peptide-methionine (S)-S-oxide reductase
MADEVDPEELSELISRVPDGWTRHVVAGAPWGVSRAEHVGGRSTTLTAAQLGGPGYLSANVWHTAGGLLLRPCEVPAADVIGFLRALPPAPPPS